VLNHMINQYVIKSSISSNPWNPVNAPTIQGS
jgi:hypothetical protein